MPIEYLPENAGVAYSKDYAGSLTHAKVNDPILQTLEFRHPDFVDADGNATSYYIVNDVRPLVATDELGGTHTFVAVPLEYVPPEQSDSGAPKPAALRLDNCSGELMRLLQLAVGSDEPVEVIDRRYLPSNTSAPHVMPPTVMELNSPMVTPETGTVQLTFGSLNNKKWPARTYTPEDFPGLAS